MKYFPFYTHYLKPTGYLSDRELGRLVRAAAHYADTHEMTELPGKEKTLFKVMVDDMDRFEDHESTTIPLVVSDKLEYLKTQIDFLVEAEKSRSQAESEPDKRSSTSRKNGAKGGRPKNLKKPNLEPNQEPKKPNFDTEKPNSDLGYLGFELGFQNPANAGSERVPGQNLGFSENVSEKRSGHMYIDTNTQVSPNTISTCIERSLPPQILPSAESDGKNGGGENPGLGLCDSSQGQVVAQLFLKDNTLFPITQGEIDTWQRRYPDIDVLSEVRGMEGWCEANVSKRKTRAGAPKFIQGWLNRTQQTRLGELRSSEQSPNYAQNTDFTDEGAHASSTSLYGPSEYDNIDFSRFYAKGCGPDD